MGILDGEEIEYLEKTKLITDFMKENGIICFEHHYGEFPKKIVISEHSITKYQHEQMLKAQSEQPIFENEKPKKLKVKDELKDFIYGDKETTKEERGALYGF